MSEPAPNNRVAEPGDALLLGVDGGGSKTIARLMTAGGAGALCVLGEGTAGGSNPLSVGPEAAKNAIREAVRGACRDGGLESAADSAVLAIAGCGETEVARDLQSWASDEGFARDVLVIDDTKPLLASVAPEDAAIGLVAGTGSSAIAKPASGEPRVLGGWGYLVDDAGSGFDLGRRGLLHAVRRIDTGGELDRITAAALTYTDAADPASFKRSVYRCDDPRRFIAGFAVSVLRLAAENDDHAEAIVEGCASALADLAIVAWRRIGDPTNPRPVVLMSGGLLERSGLYRRRVVDRLVGFGWSRDELRPAPDPATGCGILAASRLRGGG